MSSNRRDELLSTGAPQRECLRDRLLELPSAAVAGEIEDGSGWRGYGNRVADTDLAPLERTDAVHADTRVARVAPDDAHIYLMRFVRVREELPLKRGRAMAERGTGSASQDGRQLPRALREHRPQQIDPAVHSMDPAVGELPGDLTAREPEPPELLRGHHPMLCAGKAGGGTQPLGPRGAFVAVLRTHTVRNPPTTGGSPPYRLVRA